MCDRVFDDPVEKVTAEHLTIPDDDKVQELCHYINAESRNPKLALSSIRKRLNHRDPHVMMLALSVLDSCWSNCGPQFRKEVSSANFISELTSKATCNMRPIAEKTCALVKKWAEGECKTDASLSRINTMYRNLIADGYSFDTSEPKKKVVISNDPSVVHSQEEEDAIAKATALSLMDEKKASKLYPSSNGFKSNENAQGDQCCDDHDLLITLFDELLSTCTDEAHLQTDIWSQICSKIATDLEDCQAPLLSIRKRLNHRDPHVMMLALSVLDSCWSNCGPQFRKEVSSANFISELTSKATCNMRPIAEKTLSLIKKWAEGECKTDASLSLIQTMYRKFVCDGYYRSDEQIMNRFRRNFVTVIDIIGNEEVIDEVSIRPTKTAELVPLMCAGDSGIQMKEDHTDQINLISGLQSSVRIHTENEERMRTELSLEKENISIMQIQMQTNDEQLNTLRIKYAELINEMVTMKSDYQKATEQVRQLKNYIVDSKGQLRVAIRIRPTLQGENGTFISYPSATTVHLCDPVSAKTTDFTVPLLFGPQMGSSEMFGEIEELIQTSFDGNNIGIFAYGSTGSGKTHFMRGGLEDAGVVPRTVNFILKKAKDQQASAWTITLEGSAVEVYMERVHDLLDGRQERKLIMESPVRVDCVMWKTIASDTDLNNFLALCDKNRKTAATKCNEQSSRSHACIQLRLKGSHTKKRQSFSSLINLVDLGGSERLNETGAIGETQKEGIAINKSLTSLRNCIRQKLAKSKPSFRDSKLTSLLQDCLGLGTSKSLLVVCINPCDQFYEEAVRSLQQALQTYQAI